MRYATNPNTGTRNTMANQKRLFIPRIRASWYTHNPMSRKATYRPRRKSQNPTAEPDAVAWNGVAMSPRMTGISLTLRRGLYRAAFPQAIFISLCANSSKRREGDSSGRADHGRPAAGHWRRPVGHRSPVLPLPLHRHPSPDRGGHPHRRGGGAGDEVPSADVPGVPGPLWISAVCAAAAGSPTRTDREGRGAASHRGDGSLLHKLRLAGRDRDVILPELRDPPRHVSRRAMPLWRGPLLRPTRPPRKGPTDWGFSKKTPRSAGKAS